MLFGGWWLASLRAESSPPVQAEILTGMQLLDRHQCRRGETARLLVRGLEDNYRSGNVETARSDRSFSDPSPVIGRRNFDEAGQDLRLFDYFELPPSTVSGLFVVRMSPPALTQNDNLGWAYCRTRKAESAADGLTFWVEAGRTDAEAAAPPEPDRSVSLLTAYCTNSPDMNGRHCDPFVGDTPCAAELPMICYRPGRLPYPGRADGVQAEAMRELFWSGGDFALTSAIAGERFETIDDANAYCRAEFGDDWRVADFHLAPQGYRFSAPWQLLEPRMTDTVPAIGIVEDDEDLRAYLASVIRLSDQFELAFAAATVREGLDALAQQDVALCLVDLNLPDGRGVDVIRRAKAARSKALVLSVLGDRVTVMEALEAGADGYLLKSGRPETIELEIQQTLDGLAPVSPQVAAYLLSLARKPEIAPASAAEPSSNVSLTSRECEILDMFVRGAVLPGSRRNAGDFDQYGERSCPQDLCELDVHSRSEAVFEAQSLGLIDGVAAAKP
ncbi:Transcriptional regulatory protein DegU (Protease production enhancer protein), partial [Durusdinium trenchii]